MKEKNKLSVPVVLLVATLCSSCEVIGDIFGAGVYTGVFLVIFVIVLIVVVISRIFRK